MKKNIKYYDLFEDLKKYNDYWCYVVWSKRGPGKTYSALKGCVSKGIKFLYIKRTQDDVDLICTGNGDFNPFAPINRDTGRLVHPKRLRKGLGAFYNMVEGEDSNGEPTYEIDGDPLGYIFALSAVAKYKGFDMSEVDIIIFDEFIAQHGSRINHREGDMLLDLYMTVARDREARGREPLKLVLMANAVNIYTPVTETLGIIDIMAEMLAERAPIRCIEERGILLHWLIEADYAVDPNRRKTGIEKAMQGTEWGRMAFGGEFSYNDFSQIDSDSLKGYSPICSFEYKADTFYVYQHKRKRVFYICKTKQKVQREYNLNRESEQYLFWREYGIVLREAVINDIIRFDSYIPYYLIMNYTTIFRV